ncbi:hypothetical protein J2Z31_001706 [Sinorhizobium kostiense]|uniref:Transposase n=1 Tax=Sinorhizobium kostiense TaxID=76747 RepID=A0ABS4QYQ9_9HYPH|nr:hypothetical protein [Sinorhizobium kostiense]
MMDEPLDRVPFAADEARIEIEKQGAGGKIRKSRKGGNGTAVDQMLQCQKLPGRFRLVEKF